MSDVRDVKMKNVFSAAKKRELVCCRNLRSNDFLNLYFSGFSLRLKLSRIDFLSNLAETNNCNQRFSRSPQLAM